jgi:hypothetical protein
MACDPKSLHDNDLNYGQESSWPFPRKGRDCLLGIEIEPMIQKVSVVS